MMQIGHSRKSSEDGGMNSHVGHHTTHSKNFGIYQQCLDVYMGTSTYNQQLQWPVPGGWMVTTTTDKAAIAFTFTRANHDRAENNSRSE